MSPCVTYVSRPPNPCLQPPLFPTCSRSRFTGVPNYIGGFSEVRELRYSLVHPSGKKGKPFRCSTGRRTMHLRPHSLPHQSLLLPPLAAISSLYFMLRRLALLTPFLFESTMEKAPKFCDKIIFTKRFVCYKKIHGNVGKYPFYHCRE